MDILRTSSLVLVKNTLYFFHVFVVIISVQTQDFLALHLLHSTKFFLNGKFKKGGKWA